MADVITNQDLNNPNQQNQNQNQVQTNQSNQGQQQNSQTQANNQIAQNYSGSNNSGQSSGAPPNASANPNKQQGSGYTNIQRIVQANQGNKLGSTIGQNIQNTAQQTQQGVQQAQQQFQQQAGANRADTSANAQLVQQALANPTQVTGNPNQVSQFQNLLSGTYQGPKGLANAQQLQAQAQDVGQLGQATRTAAGQQGLLQRFVGNPQYSAGQQTMDSLLLGATGGNALNQARRATTGIQGQEQQAQTGAAQTAQEYANRNQQFGQNVQNQFGQNVSQQQQALTQQAQQTQQARDAQVAALQSQLGQGNLTQDVASQLGINAGDYSYGLDPSKFVSENAMQANAQNSANAQQYAQMQALAQLGGQFAPNQAQQTLAQFNNPSQAGTFQASKAYDVNAPAYQQAQQEGQQAYQNASALISPAQNAYNQAQINYRNADIAGRGNANLSGFGQAELNTRAALQAAQAQAAADLGKQYNITPDESQS